MGGGGGGQPAVTHLDQVVDGPGDGQHGPLQVRHRVTILRLFMEDHQPRHLPAAGKYVIISVLLFVCLFVCLLGFVCLFFFC